MKPDVQIGCLSYDGTQITSSLFFNHRKDFVAGSADYCEFWQRNELMIASVFTIRGITSNWKQVHCYYFSNKHQFHSEWKEDLVHVWCSPPIRRIQKQPHDKRPLQSLSFIGIISNLNNSWLNLDNEIIFHYRASIAWRIFFISISRLSKVKNQTRCQRSLDDLQASLDK